MKFMVTFGMDKGQSADFMPHREGYIGILDWDSEEVERKTDYRPQRPEGFPQDSWRFGAATYYDGKIYTCTFLEALVINARTWEVEQVISEPWFNDLHHVYANERHILIVNTGLDRVEIYNHSYEHIGFYNLLEVDTWERFDKNVDYRLVESTKPHVWQANYLTELYGKYWVTRFGNKDVLCLDDPAQRIPIDVGNPHDGHIHGDHIYYTTTDNQIVIIDLETRKTVETIDLRDLDERKERIGWCRGFEIVDRYAFVGFSRFRQSKFRAMGHWIKYGEQILPSQIIQVDLQERKIVKRCVMEHDPGCTIFTIIDTSRMVSASSATCNSAATAV